MIHSTVNRPDAWLYHLPYSKILNEHKIILGVSNIHTRFAHISIFQYISSFFYNFILFKNGILIPIALVASFSLSFFYNEFKKNYKIKNKQIYTYLTFLILIISLYSFSRYSEYGNDAQPNLYYFIFFIFLLRFFNDQKNENIFKELSLLSLFLFFMKPTYIFVSLIPLALFLIFYKKYKIIRSKFYIFYIFFLAIWLLKNVLTTGCLIYPLKQTCLDKLVWNNKNIEENILTNEAWSKGWPDLEDKSSITKSDYIKNFNWFETWKNNHFLHVIKKILPVVIFLIFNFLLVYFTKSLKKNYLKIEYLYFFLFSLFFLIIWLIKFPVYRLGISQINLFILLSFYLFFIKNIDPSKLFKLNRYFNLLIILVAVVILSKNLLRIVDNFDKSIMPNLYSINIQNQSLLKIYDKRNFFTHFITTNGEMCGYALSPCNHFKKNLLVDNKFGYKIYIFDGN